MHSLTVICMVRKGKGRLSPFVYLIIRLLDFDHQIEASTAPCIHFLLHMNEKIGLPFVRGAHT